MKIGYGIFLCLLLLSGLKSTAQVFDVDTLQFQGTTSNMVNLVILGDGYTEAQLGQFTEDARRFNEYFFSQSPYSHYRQYFNVFIIKVPSLESGVKHAHNVSDCPVAEGNDTTFATNNQVSTKKYMPAANPNNYFGSSFDNSGLHRLVVAHNQKAIKDVLAANFPNYTQTIILANSPYYGGSGGVFPTATVNMASNAIAIHELGHSFAHLADEYWPGLQFLSEDANRSQYASLDRVPWSKWIGTPGIGVFSYGGSAPNSIWFRPSEYCKMQYLTAPFCSVCSEAIIEKIHAVTNPIIRSNPSNSSPIQVDFLSVFSLRLAMPDPNTLKVDWFLNGKLVAANVDSIRINPGTLVAGINSIQAKVRDTTYMIRVDEHSKHSYQTEWLVNNPQARQLSKPVARWGDSIHTNYGQAAVLTVKNAEAGLRYNWYQEERSRKPLATGSNFITPSIAQTTTFFLESSWGKQKSDRTPVTVKVLPRISAPADVIVERVSTGDTTRVFVKNPDANFNYKWYESEQALKPLNSSWNLENGPYKFDRQGAEVRIAPSVRQGILFVEAVSKVNSTFSERKRVEITETIPLTTVTTGR